MSRQPRLIRGRPSLQGGKPIKDPPVPTQDTAHGRAETIIRGTKACGLARRPFDDIVNNTAWTPSWWNLDAPGSQSKAIRPIQDIQTVVTYSPNGDRVSQTDQDVDTTYGNPETVWEQGDVNDPTDDRCTVRTFSPDVGNWFISAPDSEVVREGGCQGTVRSKTEFGYDGRNNLNRVDAYSAAGVFSRTTSVFDGAGRVTSIDGPLSSVPNDVTSTQYHPAYGYATKVTNPLQQASETTSIDLSRMLPLAVKDANLGVTSYDYDPLGRLTNAWSPTDQGGTPAATFAYNVNQAAPTSIVTSGKQSGTVRVESSVFYDSLGQAVQSQRPYGTGRIVATNVFNNQGQVSRQIDGYAAAAGTGYIGAPALPDRESVVTYDVLGRPLKQQRLSKGGVVSETNIAYDGWTTKVTRDLGLVTRDVTDAFGQVIEHHQVRPNLTYDKTLSDFDGAGRLVSVTDPLGGITSYVTDWLGRVTRTDDPNAGTSAVVYRADGQPITLTNPNGTITTAYDVLGRPTSRTIGGGMGGVLSAEWSYDTATKGVGKLAATTSYERGVKFLTTSIVGYDGRGRPNATKYVVPSVAGWTDGGLAGTFQMGYTYNAADDQTSVTYPGVALSGLPANETVTAAYDAYGNPTTLKSSTLGTYIADSVWGTDGKLRKRTYGDVSSTAWSVVRQYKWAVNTGQIERMYAERTKTGVASVIVQDLTYRYDPLGNVTSVVDGVIDGGSRQAQCFTYADARKRLTRAFTTTAVTSQAWGATTLPSANCTAPVAGGTGSYDQSYVFDEIDRFRASGPAGTNYLYNTGSRPHAVNQITSSGGGNDTFSYDAAGNRTQYVDANGPDLTYTWDVLGRLLTATSVDGATTAKSVMRYDTNGQRLLRKDPDGTTTIYLGGMFEITDPATSTSTVVTRYYNLDGVAVAYRGNGTADGAVRYALGDRQGSGMVGVRRTDGTTQRQQFEPYGKDRSTVRFVSTDRAFLNQTRDKATGLNYLNNRYLDPTTGTFLSVDPLVGKTGQAYLYAAGNPVTYSDPSGLEPGSWTASCGGADPTCGNKEYYESEYRRMSAAQRRASLDKARANCNGGCQHSRDGNVSHDQIIALEPTVPGPDTYTGSRVGQGIMFGVLAAALAGPTIAGAVGTASLKIAVRFPKTTSLLNGLAVLGRDLADDNPGGGATNKVDDLIGAACSFSGETQVLMADGTSKPISEVAVGDEVLAYDPETGERGPRRVTHLWIHEDRMLELDLGGARVATTEDHPFWNVTDGEWQRADALDRGDAVLAADGGRVMVGGLDWASTFTGLAYNLTVDDLHTYYAQAGTKPILVHNDNTCSRALWSLTTDGASRTASHGSFGKFFQSASDGTWWVKDTAGHGGSAFKVFEESSTGLNWIADADEFGTYIIGKHKSSTGAFIPWKELAG